MSNSSSAGNVVTRLTSIEQLLKQIAQDQKRTIELLSKLLPTTISAAPREQQFRKIATDDKRSKKERILATLENNPGGISLSGISQQTNLARNTVSVHAFELVRMGLARMDDVGGAGGKRCFAVFPYDEAVQRLRRVKKGPA